jgi:hypothetical protein
MAGSVTKYDPSYPALMMEYFSVPPYKEVMKKVVVSGVVVELPNLEAADMPTLSGFAIKIGVHRETLLNWCKEFPEFNHAYKMAK